MPVYVCGGKYDGVAPPAKLEALKKQISGARLELFEGGHLFFIQDPLAFKRIEAFLLGELDASESR
jgi:3-oxoadipate enol-lactonase